MNQKMKPKARPTAAPKPQSEAAKPSQPQKPNRKEQLIREIQLLELRADTLVKSCPTVAAFVQINEQINAMQSTIRELEAIHQEAVEEARAKLVAEMKPASPSPSPPTPQPKPEGYQLPPEAPPPEAS